jgi:3-dehydroquinate dehydratase/shikimate dehydrogenase
VFRGQPHAREGRALAREAKAEALKHEVNFEKQFDVLINTTPCGMAGIKQAMPIKENELNAALVFDMVYNPLETPLLKLAHSRGIAVISGLEMFVQQGARQFEIWTGKPAPEAEMLRVVELELRRRGLRRLSVPWADFRRGHFDYDRFSRR